MGAGANKIGEFLHYDILQIIRVNFLPTLKILFFLKLEWLKIHENKFEEDYQLRQLKSVITLSILFILSLFMPSLNR